MNRKLKMFPVVCFLLFCISVTGCASVAEDKDMKISVVKADDGKSLGEEDDDLQTDEPSEPSSDDMKQSSEDKNSRSSEENTEEAQVYVYLCGAVEKEDVYCVSAGSRVNDVVRLAGGFSEGAAAQYVNLAEVVTDGERIYIPFEDEVDEDMIRNLRRTGVSDSAEVIENEDKRIVNINSADKSELMTLPGIGESKAEDIIRYREESGGFKSIEDLMNVNGIKEGIFQKLKDKITIG